MIGLAAVLLLLLLMGVCAVVTQATTLAVNPNVTVPGGRVTVTAAHVPADQIGEIQLFSRVQTYYFRADSNGDVSVEIVVPSDIDLGNHHIRLCWSNSCPKETGLRVVSGDVALASPTPVANATPGTTPSGASESIPGSTPSSRPTPTSGSTPHPTSTPTSTPKSTPIPAPTPYVTVAKISTVNGFNAVLHFFGGRTWTITLVNDTVSTTTTKGSVTVPAGNTFFTTPTYNSNGVVATNRASVKACNGSVCYSSNIVTVTLN